MDNENLKALKNSLKQEIIILRRERELMRSKIETKKELKVLESILPEFEKQINVRKLKIVTIKKNEEIKKNNHNGPVKVPEHLIIEIQMIIKKRGGSVLSCDFLKGADAKKIIKKIHDLGFDNIDSCIKSIPSITVEPYNNSYLYVYGDKKETSPMLTMDEFESSRKKEKKLNQSQKIIVEILSENPKKFLCGKEIIKGYKTRTGNMLSIPGFENIKHFLDNTKGIEVSARGYRLSKEYKEILENDKSHKKKEIKDAKTPIKDSKKETISTNTKKDTNNNSRTEYQYGQKSKVIDKTRISEEPKTKVPGIIIDNESYTRSINYDQYQNYTLEKTIKNETRDNFVEIFIFNTMRKKNNDWAVELFEKPLIDSNIILITLQHLCTSSGKRLSAINKILSEMLTSMFKFKFKVTPRMQKTVTEMLLEAENLISGELKLAFKTNFRLKNFVTAGENRLLLNNISIDSPLNWLLVDGDKKDLYEKTCWVANYLESALIIDSISNYEQENYAFFKFEKDKFIIHFKDKVEAITAIKQIELKKNRNYSLAIEKICIHYNSSICIKNRRWCQMAHVCAFCCSEDHNFLHCWEYNK